MKILYKRNRERESSLSLPHEGEVQFFDLGLVGQVGLLGRVRAIRPVKEAIAVSVYRTR